MRAGERPAARSPVRGRAGGDRRFDGERALPVLELADVEVALLAVEAGADVLPAEEDVARRLHQALTGDDALAAVAVLALADEPLEHRRLRLLDLQEQRVLVVDAEEERDPGAGADAADADDLAGQVDEPELLEQVAAVGLERPPVGADEGAHLLLELRPARRASGRSSSIGTISGGSLMMRGSPSTRWVSFSNACMLSLVRDFSMLASAFFSRFGSTPAVNSATACSTDRCAYQTSRLRICAKAVIASR